jgi:hypothetical protein
MKKAWHRRARHAVAHSLKVRLVLVFLLLAGAMAFIFVSSLQKAFSIGWRDAARPMLMDYVDHLAADITPDPGGLPNVARAQALTQRLPVTVRIQGPQVNWQSHPTTLPANAGVATKTGTVCSSARLRMGTPLNLASTTTRLSTVRV